MRMMMSWWIAPGLLNRSRRIGLWRAHNQLAVLHALQANQAAREFLHAFELALHHDDFQTHIVIEMRMHGRDNEFVILMLQCGQLVSQQAEVMVVNQGYGSHHEAVARFQRGLIQTIANKIAESFGAVIVTFVAEEVVKPFQEIRVKRDSSAGQSHGVPRSGPDRNTNLRIVTLKLAAGRSFIFLSQ